MSNKKIQLSRKNFHVILLFMNEDKIFLDMTQPQNKNK